MSEWHLVTGEYPPQRGGVSDYTLHVAAGLAEAGDEVHVWCPPENAETPAIAGVTVHRELGRASPADLRRVDDLLSEFSGPRRIVVQWVPHAFGYRAMNVAFARWVRRRARHHGDRVGLMVHEAHVAFGSSRKEDVIAAANRIMDVLILSAADRVWTSTPAWIEALAPYRLGRDVPFEWVPVPSNVPRVEQGAGSAERLAPSADRLAASAERGAVGTELLAPSADHGAPGSISRGADSAAARVGVGDRSDGAILVGHFGTYGKLIAPLLDELIPDLLGAEPRVTMVLLGRGAGAFRTRLIAGHPEWETRVGAPGCADDRELSIQLAACDLFVQPYPEGLSARRGSAMAVVGHGRPMVSNSGRYTERVWADYAAAELVPMGEGMAGMAAAAASLARDEGRRREMSEAADRLYAERFHVRHTIAALRRWAADAAHPADAAATAAAVR